MGGRRIFPEFRFSSRKSGKPKKTARKPGLLAEIRKNFTPSQSTLSNQQLTLRADDKLRGGSTAFCLDKRKTTKK